MTKNPYKLLTRPHTKKVDIIRATLPSTYDNCHVYATCSSIANAEILCRLLNLGLEVTQEQEQEEISLPKKRKSHAR